MAPAYYPQLEEPKSTPSGRDEMRRGDRLIRWHLGGTSAMPHIAKTIAASLLVYGVGLSAANAQHMVAATDTSIVTSTSDTSTALLPEAQIQHTGIVSTTLNNHLTNLQSAKALENAQMVSVGSTGVSAGEQQAPLGQNLSVWLSYSHNEAENDSPGIAYDSDTDSITAGVDYILGGPLTIGFFVSQSWTDTDSAFNGGGSETDSTTFGPYVSVTLTDWLSFDASYARTNSSTDNTRVTALGARVTGTQDGTTDFFSLGASASHWFQNSIGLSGRVGFNTSHTENDAYTDSTNTLIAGSKSDLKQVQIGGRVMYYTTNVMPYFGATYIADVDRENVRTAANPQPANDEDDVLLQAGVSLFGDTPFSGSLDLSYNAAREENEAWGIGGNVSYRF